MQRSPVCSLLVAWLVPTLIGCDRVDAPTAPERHAVASAEQPSLLLIASDTLSLFDDALGRILPGIEDRELAIGLRAALALLSDSSGDVRIARETLAHAQRLLEQHMEAVHPANLGTLRDVLSRAQSRLEKNDHGR